MCGMNEELWLSHAEEVRPLVDLQERIWDELHGHPDTDTADVFVWVEDFVVTLSGSVTSDSARSAVEQAAGRVRGVRQVINELHVMLSQPDRRLPAVVIDDLLIAR